MPRRSLRNLLRQFRHLGVDVAGKSATVSDEVALTYQLDDVSPLRLDATANQYGGSTFVFNVVGNFGCIELQVNNPGGVRIDFVHVGSSAGLPVSGTVFTTQTQRTLLPVVEVMTAELHSSLVPSQSGFRAGNLVFADVPPFGYRYIAPDLTLREGLLGFFVQGPVDGVPTFFYNVMSRDAFAVVGLRWTELADPEIPS